MRRTILLWLGLLSASPAFAADISGLRAVVELALENAPALRAAEAERKAAAEDKALGRAWLLPYVVANASFARKNQDYNYDRRAAFLSPTVHNNEQLFAIKAYQPLFDLEKWAGYQQGKIAAATGALKLALQRQQTMLDAAAAWLDVMRAQAAVAAAKASEAAMDKLAMQAEAAFEVGTAAVNEALAASSRRDLTKAARIRAEQNLTQAVARLESLIGRQVSVPAAPPRGIAPLQVEMDDPAAWEQRAETQALGVRLREKAVAMADAGHLKSVGGALPKVQLVASWMRDRSSDGVFGGVTVKEAAIAIEVSMPLYAGGGTWAQQRKSTQQKIQAEFEREEARRTARLAARQALLELRATAAEVRALDTALSSAETEQKAAQAGFEVGVRGITDVLDAEERLAAARSRYADAVARHAMAYLQLMAVVDRLDASALASVDQWFTTGGQGAR